MNQNPSPKTPQKLTAKQEKFVEGIAKGMTQSDAYRAAYNVENMMKKTVWERASVVAADSKVATRLFELQEAAKERHLVTIESITKELEEAREVAKGLDQSSAMTQASMGKAKVNGLLVDKKEHTSPDGSMSHPTIIELIAGNAESTD